MRKTTVYLPDALKGALERLAASTGRSEADLIREAIDSLTTAHREQRPRLGVIDVDCGPFAERVDELLAKGFGRD